MSILSLNPNIPFGISPASPYRKVNARVEIAAARVAGKLNLPFVQNLFSPTTIESLASIAPTAPKWIALYPFIDRNITKTIIASAEKAGFEGLMIVLEEAVVNDIFPPIPELLGKYKPRLLNDLIEKGLIGAEDTMFLIEKTIESNYQYIKWLMDITKLQIIVKSDFSKGYVFPDGIAGMCITNHEEIANANTTTLRRIPIIVSEDIISEQDAATALNSGAKLILIEKPIQWGFKIDGQQGIEDVINLYKRIL